MVSVFFEKGYGVYISFYFWVCVVREVELGWVDIFFFEYFIEGNVIFDNFLDKIWNDLFVLSYVILGGDLFFVVLKGN